MAKKGLCTLLITSMMACSNVYKDKNDDLVSKTFNDSFLVPSEMVDLDNVGTSTLNANITTLSASLKKSSKSDSSYDKNDNHISTNTIDEVFKYSNRVFVELSINKNKIVERHGGTAFLINDPESKRLYAVTASHIFPRWDDSCFKSDVNCKVRVGEYSAEVVARSREDDVAILKLQEDASLPYYGKCLAMDFSVGDVILGVGNSLGANSLLEGKIRAVSNNKERFQMIGDFNSGDSGGPLYVLEKGVPKVVGIASGWFYDEKGHRGGVSDVMSSVKIAKMVDAYKEGSRKPLAHYNCRK